MSEQEELKYDTTVGVGLMHFLLASCFKCIIHDLIRGELLLDGGRTQSKGSGNGEGAPIIFLLVKETTRGVTRWFIPCISNLNPAIEQ